MDNYTLVRPEHLNHHGFLFGGSMLKWVDEYSWLVASLDFPGCTLVTMAMDNIVFKEAVHCGSILRFNVLPLRQGVSSVTYRVHVYADEPGAMAEKLVFTTTITFVRVTAKGKKAPLPVRTAYRSQYPDPDGAACFDQVVSPDREPTD